MQIHEIATKTGQDSKQVATELGMEWKQGVALRQIDDEQALAYIALKGEVEPPPSESGEEQEAAQGIRFWTTKRRYMVPAEGGRGEIRFHKGVVSLDEGSTELAFMRKNHDYFIAQGVYEVSEKPHSNPMQIAKYINALKGTIRTGPPNDATTSRAMRDCVKMLLRPEVADKMSSAKQNEINALVDAVAGSTSLVVSEYQEKL